MSECVNLEVREALPDLLNGRLGEVDTATMNAHVESCADCRAELELLRRVRSSAPLAPKMNAPAIAASIPAYGGTAIRKPSQQKPFFTLGNSIRIAAVASIIAVGSLMLRGSDEASRPESAPAQTAASAGPSVPREAPAVETPDAAQDPATQVASLSFMGGTSDLSDADLEQLVSELEQIESLPSEEPQSVTTTVEDISSNEDSGL